MGSKSQSYWAKERSPELANWACVLHQFRWKKFRGRHSLVWGVGWGVLYWGAPALHRVCVGLIIFYNTIVHIGLWHLVRRWFSGHTEMLSYACKMFKFNGTMYFSQSCSIEVPLSNNVVIVSGSRVQMYTISGPSTQLPDLQQSRRDPACGYFYDSGDQLVNSKYRICLLRINKYVPILHTIFVNSFYVISVLCRSTWWLGVKDQTIHTWQPQKSWARDPLPGCMLESCPHPDSDPGLLHLTINWYWQVWSGCGAVQCCTMIPCNIYRFILTGGFTKSGGTLGISDNAFEWDTTTSTWKEMPSLKISRAWHAMSVIENANDIISSYCK